MSENFDLTDWLIGGTAHRARKNVTIYRDANLGDRIAELEKKISEAEYHDTDSLAGENKTTLEERKAQLLEEIQSASATVEVFGLIDSEIDAIDTEIGKDAPAIERTYKILEKAGTIEGQTLTADQWRTLHETVGTQFNLVADAYRRATVEPVTARFRS